MFVPPVAVSPGDQLLHPEKKKTKAERGSEGDQVDSAQAKREYLNKIKIHVISHLIFYDCVFIQFDV